MEIREIPESFESYNCISPTAGGGGGVDFIHCDCVNTLNWQGVTFSDSAFKVKVYSVPPLSHTPKVVQPAPDHQSHLV